MMAMDLRREMRRDGRLETCTERCRSVWVFNVPDKRLVPGIMHDALGHEDAGAEYGWTWAGRWEHAGVAVDVDRHEATVDGATVDLTPTEMRILAILTRLGGAVATFELILGRVWGPGYEIVGPKLNRPGGDSNFHLVQVNVCRLRAKIGRDRIVRAYGVGYRLKD